MLILQKNLQKNSIFLKNFWSVWPVNFLLLTRMTRNIFLFDPPTRRKFLTRPDPTRGSPWKALPVDPWQFLTLTRQTREKNCSWPALPVIYFLEIFSQNLKLFGQKSLFSVRSMLILQKKLPKISFFVKNFWPVWPVNFLLSTRLTRNIFPFDPPTRWKIVAWPVTRPDPWNFQICWPDPTRPVENLLLPDPTRPAASLQKGGYL